MMRHRPAALARFATGISLLLAFTLLLLSAVTVGQGAASVRSHAPTGAEVSASNDALSAAALSLERGQGPASGSNWSCSAASSGGAIDCAARSADAAPSSAQVPGWQSEGLAPPATGGLLAYDSYAREVIYLGAPPSCPDLDCQGVTWAYSGGIWSNLDLSVAPGPCEGVGNNQSATLIDDPGEDGLLYFAGEGCAAQGQTWVFQTIGWTQLHPTVSPPASTNPAFAYDPAISAAVLFGATASPAAVPVSNQTWTFAGGTWTNLTPTLPHLPTARFSGALVYDPAIGQILLFGGISGGSFASGYLRLNDTWSFNGTAWTNLTPVRSPPSMAGALLAYDAQDGYVLLAGGSNGYGCDRCFSQSWEFSNDTWTPLASDGPGGEAGQDGVWAIAYDNATSSVVLFGGTYSTAEAGQTWTYSAGHWTNDSSGSPGPRSGAAMAYDPVDGYVVLFGGTNDGQGGPPDALLNDTWTYRGGIWTDITRGLSSAPSPRYGASLAFDASDGYMVLFGGLTSTCMGVANPSSVPCNDTWEFVRGTWTELTPRTSPPARYDAAMTYDAYDGYVLLFGGTYRFGLNDTWSFHAGIWTNLTASLAVAPTGGAIGTFSMTYDAADSYVLLAGVGWGAPPWSANETWAYRADHWTNLTGSVGVDPALAVPGALAYDPVLNQTVLFGQCNGAGCSLTSATWIYSSGAWAEVFPVSSPSPRNDPALTYDAADGYPLLFGGQNSNGTLDDSWVWTNTTPPGLSVESFSAAPATIDLGQTTTITVATNPSNPGLSYTFVDLPSGCVSQNLSTIACMPTVTGSYSLGVVVRDPGGNQSTARTTLQVNPRPQVSAFSATPDPAVVGQVALLAVTAAGGTGALSYVFDGLPPGCSSQTVPTLPCDPSQAGNYTVDVVVSDSLGGNGTGQLTFSVSPAGTGAAPRIDGFAAVPSSFVLGNWTVITTTIVGGGAGDTLAYFGVPTGCTAANVSSFNCTPTASGGYTVTVAVTDPEGASTSVNLSITVYPAGGGGAPAITAFVASQRVVSVGNTTVLEVSASGGVGWLSFRFSDLPTGCSSANVSALACTPTAAGTFQVYVVVEDAKGAVAGVHTPLTVLGPSPPGGGAGAAGVGGTIAWSVTALLIGVAVAVPFVAWENRRRRLRSEGEALIRAIGSDPDPAKDARED